MVSLVPLISIAHNIIYRTMNYYIFIKNMNLNLIFFNPINGGVGMMVLSWHLTKKQINKLNHIKNGNIGQNKPKIL